MMELIIKVPFSTGEEMEKNFNRAVSDFATAVKRKGLCEMELTAADLENPDKPIYEVLIKSKTQDND